MFHLYTIYMYTIYAVAEINTYILYIYIYVLLRASRRYSCRRRQESVEVRESTRVVYGISNNKHFARAPPQKIQAISPLKLPSTAENYTYTPII